MNDPNRESGELRRICRMLRALGAEPAGGEETPGSGPGGRPGGRPSDIGSARPEHRHA